MRLRALAPAKVNLGLFLGPTRARDSRHELVTLFQSLSLCDVLTLETLPAGADDCVVCPGVEGENLAARALAALRSRGWDGPPVRITIDKRIPVAAGMAGGSADAAATLRLAMAAAPGPPADAEAVAAELGADVPAQLTPGVALGTGAGEIVERFEALPAHAYVVVPSEVGLSTPDVFRAADRLGLSRAVAELRELEARLRSAVATHEPLPAQLLVNDLQPAAVALLGSIEPTLAAVSATGADHVLVSGSGPTVVGLWWGERGAPQAEAAAARLRAAGHRRTVAATPVAPEAGRPGLDDDG